MKKSKFTESQIVAVLKQGDAGVPVKDLCRQTGISSATYYQWKSKYGGMEASDLRRVRELEAENAKLKRMYAELALDVAAMKDLIAKKGFFSQLRERLTTDPSDLLLSRQQTGGRPWPTASLRLSCGDGPAIGWPAVGVKSAGASLGA